MMDEKKRDAGSDLADELGETVATLARLGVTLAALPIAFLPRQQRERIRQLTSELARIGAAVPRAIGTVMEEVAVDWQDSDNRREDLGSRLRRAKLESEADPQEEGESLPDEEEATEKVQDDIQESWNDQ